MRGKIAGEPLQTDRKMSGDSAHRALPCGFHDVNRPTGLNQQDLLSIQIFFLQLVKEIMENLCHVTHRGGVS